LAIKILEKPKGCLRILRLFTGHDQLTVREIMRDLSLSQSGAYSSLDHLARLGLIERESSTTGATRGLAREYCLTNEGEELLIPLSVYFDLLKLVFRREDIDSYLSLPYRSMEILVKIHSKGNVCFSELVKKEGICKSTASSVLRTLQDCGLLEVSVKTSLRRTEKRYSLTETGQCVARVLVLVNQTMRTLVGIDRSQQ
jgi:DNA-binding HxlR family transcriptional regulator